MNKSTLFADDQGIWATVQALETAALLPDYRRRVLSWAPQNAQFNPGPVGAFIGRVIPAASSKRG